jgi:hypothetical protein
VQEEMIIEYKRRHESNASYFFLETTITVIMKFTYVMGTSFTKLRLFFHKVSCIINTFFHVCVRCPNQFRAICAGIEGVKTTNSKGSAEKEDESSPGPA